MSYVEPTSLTNIEKFLSFDFPEGVFAAACRGNLDTQNASADFRQGRANRQEAPLRQQRGANLQEGFRERTDALNCDLIIDQASVPGESESILFHTARLRGSFVKDLATPVHRCDILINITPIINPASASLNFKISNTLIPGAHAPNEWFWWGTPPTDFICTIEQPFNANDLTAEEIYRVIIRWQFWHAHPDGTRTREPFGGFEDSLTFQVRSV